MLVRPQVCTGVYKPGRAPHQDQSGPVTEALACGLTGQVLQPELLEPHHVVEDVEAAVDLLLQDNSVTSLP